jgi:peptidoglycan/xylan/chitin deacetylase (PgdA/CDA1 family)
MQADESIFTISIDFELHWGTRDHRTLADYGPNILGGRAAVPQLLQLFEEFQVHATWAVVGFVLFPDADALLASVPSVLPEYAAAELSPYGALDAVRTGADSAHYFAPELVEMIRQTPRQEVASHTFSHYYCLEAGQTLEAFAEDLRAMRDAARQRLGTDVESLVFPRNQYNERYLEACRSMGIKAYRGNPTSWAYAPRAEEDETLLRRAVRLADSYVNLTGHHGYRLKDLGNSQPFDVPASRFLRPFSRRLRALEPVRLRRIQGDLDHAAKNGRLYHLWWHPENFGRDSRENLAFLRQVLTHFSRLRDRHGMQSLAMGEVASVLQARATPGQASA